MASERFKTIFDRNVSQFVGCFAVDANSLFKDEKDRLIHPGEYGRYREDACKNMLRLVLSSQVAIGDGFVFTSKNGITTQCDIIVHNATIMPLITDGISRMFPAEEVRMIGEIKSTLSRQDYITALRKMAENKRIILDDRTGTLIKRNGEDESCDTVGSFLVCSKMNFDYRSLKYEEIYEGIERKYWHNAVLSIEDGFFAYGLDFSQADYRIQEGLRAQRFNMDLVPIWVRSVFAVEGIQLETIQGITGVQEDKYEHIIKFFVEMAKLCKDIWIYEYDPIVYLGFAVDSLLVSDE